jgi:hypothetical protein
VGSGGLLLSTENDQLRKDHPMPDLDSLTETQISQRLRDLPPSRYSELLPGYPPNPIRPAAVLVPLLRH